MFTHIMEQSLFMIVTDQLLIELLAKTLLVKQLYMMEVKMAELQKLSLKFMIQY